MDNPIRILHIVTTMDIGGLETFLMNYYRNIDRSKIQFDFLTHRKHIQDYEREIQQLGGKIYKINSLNPFSLKYRKELNNFFKSHDEYKIVHSHLDCMSSIPLKYAKRNGVPVRIAHSHSASQEKNYKYLLKLYFKKQIPKYATNLFSCGIKAGQWMFGNHDFQVLNNAIETGLFAYDTNIRNKYRNDFNLENNIVIGNVANFKDVKNHSFMIDVFFHVKKINPNFKLVLVGNGELYSEIVNKIKKLNLENEIILLGVRNDVCNLLQMFDIFFLPSLYEGFPVSLVEAQCSGLQCITSKNVSYECDLTNLVHHYSLEDSAEKWAKKIVDTPVLNNNRHDYSNKIISKGFNIQDEVRKLTDFYIRNFEKEKELR